MSNYNTDDFNTDTTFIPISNDCICNCGDVIVDVDGIMEAIEDAKNEVKEQLQEQFKDTKEQLQEQFKDTNKHIHCSTEHIIDKIPCMCNVATKKDIQNAVDKVNQHTDSKFDEVDFIKNFTDLNNEIKKLNKNGE